MQKKDYLSNLWNTVNPVLQNRYLKLAISRVLLLMVIVLACVTVSFASVTPGAMAAPTHIHATVFSTSASPDHAGCQNGC